MIVNLRFIVVYCLLFDYMGFTCATKHFHKTFISCLKSFGDIVVCLGLDRSFFDNYCASHSCDCYCDCDCECYNQVFVFQFCLWRSV
jgi:hypothetical protein